MSADQTTPNFCPDCGTKWAAGHDCNAAYYTITSADVGRAFLNAFGKTWPVSGFMGRILPGDVGKRVYRVQYPAPRNIDILQVENDQQRDTRLARLGTDD